jgi:hypothetical protein
MEPGEPSALTTTGPLNSKPPVASCRGRESLPKGDTTGSSNLSRRFPSPFYASVSQRGFRYYGQHIIILISPTRITRRTKPRV